MINKKSFNYRVSVNADIQSVNAKLKCDYEFRMNMSCYKTSELDKSLHKGKINR